MLTCRIQTWNYLQFTEYFNMIRMHVNEISEMFSVTFWRFKCTKDVGLVPSHLSFVYGSVRVIREWVWLIRNEGDGGKVFSYRISLCAYAVITWRKIYQLITLIFSSCTNHLFFFFFSFLYRTSMNNSLKVQITKISW